MPTLTFGTVTSTSSFKEWSVLHDKVMEVKEVSMNMNIICTHVLIVITITIIDFYKEK